MVLQYFQTKRKFENWICSFLWNFLTAFICASTPVGKQIIKQRQNLTFAFFDHNSVELVHI